MKPISGLIELPDDLLTDRDAQIHREISGLGPPDLVLLEKVKGKNPPIRYYHHACGGKISSADSFINYLRKLSKKKLGKGKYVVSSGEYCCWNSFRATDVRISMNDMTVSGVKLVNFDGEGTIDDEKIWEELEICSVLRFFTIPSALFRAVYNFPYYNCSALKLSRPGTLTDEQIQFLVDKHPKSEDVEVALAGLLLSLGDRSRIQNLLENVIIKKMPRVIIPLYQLLPKRVPFIKNLVEIAKQAYLSYSDDPELAFAFVNMCLDANKPEALEIVLPFIRSSMWSSPYSCCAMARILAREKKTEEAMFCVNAAFYSKTYSSSSRPILTCVIPHRESKSAPKVRPNTIDGELVSSQWNQLQSVVYTTVLDICKTSSPYQILDLLGRKFSVSKDSQIMQGNNKLCLDDVEHWPPCDELDCLFDPGINTDTSVPEVIRQLPLCAKFTQYTKDISEDWNMREAIIRGKKLVVSSDVRRGLLVALRMKDWEMLQNLKTSLKSAKKLDVVSELVTFCLSSAEKWASTSKKFSKRVINPKKVTVHEYNALMVMYSLADGIDMLLKQ